ncbi:MAG: 30S ribosomal protein S6 [Patescibacteria group bacterium]
MNHYELLYIIPLKMESDSIDPTAEKVNSLLKQLGATITLQDNLGKRKLAYPIKHVRYGYYVLTEFDLDSEPLKKLERELTLSTDVLRYQILRKKIKSQERLAEEKALQDKLKSQHLREETKMAETEAKVVSKETTTKIDDLDKKLEEILENEIVK